jgi:2-polyprenyl-3-methyl-5-hydroxy-6-metoxy-1,4-benzoquinol methylase
VPTADFSDVGATIQLVRLELYRENIEGALALLDAAAAVRPDPRYASEAEGIRRALSHVESREAYVAAQEGQYRQYRGHLSLRYLNKRLRMLSGRKTRKLIARRADQDAFRLLEREVIALRPARVLDGGTGEGGTALALGSRHPEVRVEGVEVSPTNVRMARQLNRFANVGFRQGLLEEVDQAFPAASFDLVYSFAVLEHVRDVEATLRAIFTVLRPGGRFCFAVPMLNLVACGPLPPYRPIHGYCDHVRAFTEAGLRERFGASPAFVLEKIQAVEKVDMDKIPPFLTPLEVGAFFVAVTAPAHGGPHW